MSYVLCQICQFYNNVSFMTIKMFLFLVSLLTISVLCLQPGSECAGGLSDRTSHWVSAATEAVHGGSKGHHGPRPGAVPHPLSPAAPGRPAGCQKHHCRYLLKVSSCKVNFTNFFKLTFCFKYEKLILKKQKWANSDSWKSEPTIPWIPVVPSHSILDDFRCDTDSKK